jgi:hypothetical protein
MYQRAHGEYENGAQKTMECWDNGSVERCNNNLRNETYGSMNYWTQRKTVPETQWNDGEWNDGEWGLWSDGIMDTHFLGIR